MSGWKDVSEVKSTGSFPEDPSTGSPWSVTPVSGDPTTSSDFPSNRHKDRANTYMQTKHLYNKLLNKYIFKWFVYSYDNSNECFGTWN